LLPCSSPPPYLRCDARDRPPGFTRRPRSWRDGLIPPEARTSFPSLSSTRHSARSARLRTLSRTGLRRLPRRPGPHAPESPRSGGFRCFEAFLPPRVRAHGAPLSRTHRSRCSPGLCPSRALIRSSLGPSHDPADHSVRRRLVTAVAKGATPRRQVRPNDLAAATTSSASDPQGYCEPSRATSRWQSCLPRPWSLQNEPATRSPRRCEDLDQLPSPRDGRALLGFRASSVTSRPRGCTPALVARREVTLATLHRRIERLVSECPTHLRVDRDSLAPLRRPSRRHRVGCPVGTQAVSKGSASGRAGSPFRSALRPN
jgi:hypothetical protein